MYRLGSIVLLGAGVLSAAMLIAVGIYRSGKLAILAPRQLQGALVWSGERNAPCTLLMIGDSHIARWRPVPPPGWRVARLGFPGEAAVNIAPTAPGAIAASAPDALLIAAGTNDASAAALQVSRQAATVERAAEAVERITASARSASVNRVLVATLVPPRSQELSRRLIYGARQTGTFAALSRRMVASAKRNGVEILDADALARAPGSAFRPELRADSLHWSPAGYDVLNAALWERLGPCRQRSRAAALRASIASDAALASRYFSAIMP